MFGIKSSARLLFFREDISLSSMGIYVMENTTSGYIAYVGQSVDLLGRRKNHYNDLDQGIHTNKRLQEDFNKNGSHFVFQVIEYVYHQSLLLTKEKEWIDRLNPICNISGRAVKTTPPIYILQNHTSIICPSCRQYTAMIMESLGICFRCYRNQLSYGD